MKCTAAWLNREPLHKNTPRCPCSTSPALLVAATQAVTKCVLDEHTGAARKLEVPCQAPEGPLQCFQQTWAVPALQTCRMEVTATTILWLSLMGQCKAMTTGCHLRPMKHPSRTTGRRMMWQQALLHQALALSRLADPDWQTDSLTCRVQEGSHTLTTGTVLHADFIFRLFLCSDKSASSLWPAGSPLSRSTGPALTMQGTPWIHRQPHQLTKEQD